MNIKNNITLIGRLTNDIETSCTPSGKLVTHFTVACDRDFVSTEGDRKADFINCIAWGKKAEFLSKYFKKGSPIMLNGSLRNNNWTDKDGIKRFSFVVNVDTLTFALTAKSKNEASNNDFNPNDIPLPEEDFAENLSEFDYMDGVAF